MDSYSRDGDDRGSRERSMDAYGRRRSPAPTDRRARISRGRSRSPPNIDRYQPDRSSYRERDDDRAPPPRRRGSPPPVQAGIDRYVPGQEPLQPVVTTNLMKDPLKMDYQVGFSYFSEWWRMDQYIQEEKERQKNGGRLPSHRLRGDRESREERAKERELIQAAYDSYKEKLQVQMAKTFVQQHKNEEWFKERYVPEMKEAFRDRLCEFRRAAYEHWESDLLGGYFDEFTLEGIYKGDSNGAGGIVEKEEGETTAANEVLGVADLVPSRGGDLRDEAGLQPTLLVKTIAPTVSREKLESFCKEHLGEGENGFRWLSLSDPNPLKKYHRIGWVMLNASTASDAPEPKIENPDADEDMGDAEEGAVRDFEPEAPVQLNAAQRAQAEINGKTIEDEARGNFTCHVGIHEPPAVPRKKALWDLFSAPERIDRDLQLAERLVGKFDEELGPDYNGIARAESRVEELRSKGWLQPPANAYSAPKKEPEELEEGEDPMEEEEGAYDEEIDDEELLAKKKKLDLLVEYLRRVYNFCFFCVFESDSVHELTRKCPGGHLRRPRSSLTTAAKAAARASAAGESFPFKRQDSKEENGDPLGSPVEEKKENKFLKTKPQQHQLQRAFNWVKTFEDKIFQILEPENADLKKLGGKPIEDALEEELKKFVKQEDEAKFRCRVPECTKLFKAENFWRKHVEKRHTEFYEKTKQDVTLVNAYVLDPAHIAPSRSDANSNGHFANNNQAPMGTPRGFNLANMPPAFQGNGMANAAAFQAFMNTYGVPPPAGFGVTMGDDGQGGPRRGNNRPNNRAPGPYDGRPGRDQRNQRWQNGGRLSPPPGRGQGGPRRGYADGGGPASVGPRESVQGRSIKSYEDLDAAAGAGTGELDY